MSLSRDPCQSGFCFGFFPYASRFTTYGNKVAPEQLKGEGKRDLNIQKNSLRIQ